MVFIGGRAPRPTPRAGTGPNAPVNDGVVTRILYSGTAAFIAPANSAPAGGHGGGLDEISAGHEVRMARFHSARFLPLRRFSPPVGNG